MTIGTPLWDEFVANLKEVKVKKAIQMSEDSQEPYQVWAKVGKDEEYYFIQDYYIVSNDYRILIAAEYIGMEQLFR